MIRTDHFATFAASETHSYPDVAHLFSRVVNAVHLWNPERAQDERIAVAFPDYSIQVFLKAGETARERTCHDRTLGRRIRLFGAKQPLRGLLASPAMQFAMLSNAFERTPVTAVSKITPRGHVVFRRDRRTEKAYIGFALRSEERFLARAATRGQEVSGQTLRQRTAAVVGRSDEMLPFLTLNSTSTGQSFGFHIAREEVDAAPGGEINSYGLSKRVDAAGAAVAACVLPVF